MLDLAETVSHIAATVRAVIIAMVATALVVIPLTLRFAYKLWHVEPKPTGETYAPGYPQPDGSRVADRIPMEKADLPPAPHILPKGTQEVRRIRITVDPRPAHHQEPAKPDVHGLCPLTSCPAVTVDLSLVRQKEGSYRAVASSPDGDVLTAIDVPVIEFGRPQPRNAIHLHGNPHERTYAADYQRSFTAFGKTFDAGVIVLHSPETGFVPMGSIGFHF